MGTPPHDPRFAALKLNRHCRALADTAMALELAPSAKVAFRRAQALLAIGACDLALAAMAPYGPDEPDLKRLTTKAREKRRPESPCPPHMYVHVCSL